MTEERKTPSPDPRFLRDIYCCIQGGAFVVLAVVGWMTKRFERIYDELGMRDLPPPTELFLAFAKFTSSPLGLAVYAFSLVVLIVLARRGTMDRGLNKLILGNILGVVGLSALMIWSTYMPIVKIQQVLDQK